MKIIQSNINPKQRGMIFGLAKTLGISNDELHDYMQAWAGTKSLQTESCTSAQANKIIEALQNIENSRLPLTKGECPKGEGVNRKPGDATENQINAIKGIAHSYGWSETRLAGFMQHTLGKTDLSGLKVREASRLISGLKNMKYTAKNKPPNKSSSGKGA